MRALLEKLNLPTVIDVRSVQGGDTNKAFRIDTTTSTYFLKTNKNDHPQFFEKEAEGLEKLSQFVRTPEVLQAGQFEQEQYLLMEWIEQGSRDDYAAGKRLADLHQVTAEKFGLGNSNFIGSLPQDNSWKSSWNDFYLEQRLLPQVEMAKSKNVWNSEREELFLSKIPSIQRTISGDITPSLLHGDLWNGNVIADQNGRTVFIDPAIYFGDREVDLAFSSLFGGFSGSFYQGYEEEYPMREGFEERIPIYQLFYILLHLNSFGEAYGIKVEQLLRKLH